MKDIQNLDLFLAQKLRVFRQKLDWPLKTLAGKLDISLQQLQRYELGVNKISASMLFRLCHLFQTSLESFFEGFEENLTSHVSEELRILLIDSHDEFLFRKALKEWADKIEILGIHDVDQAMRFIMTPVNLLQFVPDIIFLDIHMNHLQGFDILQSIKRRPYWEDIPVIILSATIKKEEVAHAYHLRANSFIHKSFDFPSFQDSLEKTLAYWKDIVRLPKHTGQEASYTSSSSFVVHASPSDGP